MVSNFLSLKCPIYDIAEEQNSFYNNSLETYTPLLGKKTG